MTLSFSLKGRGGGASCRTGPGAGEHAARTGGEAHWHPADVGSPAGKQALVHAVQQGVGPIDVLVHNAGVFPLASIEALTEAQLEEALAVNLKAAFWLTRAVVPVMRTRGHGRLLFTSSVTRAWPRRSWRTTLPAKQG